MSFDVISGVPYITTPSVTQSSADDLVVSNVQGINKLEFLPPLNNKTGISNSNRSKSSQNAASNKINKSQASLDLFVNKINESEHADQSQNHSSKAEASTRKLEGQKASEVKGNKKKGGTAQSAFLSKLRQINQDGAGSMEGVLANQLKQTDTGAGTTYADDLSSQYEQAQNLYRQNGLNNVQNGLQSPFNFSV